MMYQPRFPKRRPARRRDARQSVIVANAEHVKRPQNFLPFFRSSSLFFFVLSYLRN